MNDRVDAPMNERSRLDQLCVDTLRTLSIDAVQQANSGHPGTPMGAAPIASVEAASPLGWERHVGRRGTIIGMRSFGIPAPGKVAQAHCGFDVAHVVAAAREQIARHAQRA